MSSVELSRSSAFRHSDIASSEPAGEAVTTTAAGSSSCRPCESRANYRKEMALFEDGMMQVLDERTNDMPAESAALVRASAQHQLRQVMREVFGAPLSQGQECLTSGEMIERIQKAGNKAVATLDKAVAEAMDRLMAVAAQRAGGPVTPQIVRKADGGFNLIRRVPPIENLVLSGGGAKGVGMGGALLALADAGLLDELHSVAGSSAGALVATWISVGRDLGELNGILTGQLRQLLATDGTLNAIYPDISFKDTARITARLLSPFGATHDTATGIIRKLDEITAQEVRDFLRTRDAEGLRRDVTVVVAQRRKDAGGTGALSDGAVQQEVDRTMARLAELAQTPDFTRSRAGRMVTFSDIALLHALAPEKFREVALSVHDTTTGKNIAFDKQTAPFMPIAYGARASMAHPLIATGVSFPQFSGPSARHVFSDGGISSNIPIETLVPLSRGRSNSDPTDLRSPAQQRQWAASTVMVFDNAGETNKIMHAPPEDKSSSGMFQRIFGSISSAVMGWVASNPNLAADTEADKKKVHDFGPNVVNVKHGDLSTMDLDATGARRQDALTQAHADATQQMKIVRGDLYAVDVGSVEEAFGLLDEEEKALLRRGNAAPAAQAPHADAQHQLARMAFREQTGREHVAASTQSAELDDAVSRLFIKG